MAFQAFQPTAFQSGGNVPDPALRNLRFTNGQSQEQVNGLVGFAGSALIWASAAALVLFVPQPTLQAAEMTFGQHEAFVVQANQSAQYFNSCVIPGNILQPPANRIFVKAAPQVDANEIQPVTFEPMMQVAHDRGTFGSVYPDAELTEWNPSFFNRFFRAPAAAVTNPVGRLWTSASQESGEQTQPLYFGQQPLPAPALGQLRYTSSEVDLSNRSIFWGGTPTLPIAATQTILPALKPIIVGGQETEPVQPVFAGQQPLPAPAFKPWTAVPQESVRDFAYVWSGSQTLLGVVAAAPVRQIVVVGQESTEQAQPGYWGGRATLNLAAIQFYLPPGHEFVAAPQESVEQPQPLIFGQQPLPSPAVGLSKVAAPSDPEAIARASEYATFWEGHAALFIAATQYNLPPAREFATGPQESTEQTQPIFKGQTPRPSPAFGLSKFAAPADSEAISRASEYTAFWGGDATLPLAAIQFDLPAGKRFTASPQESGEQQQPVVRGQTPLPSPVVGLSKISAPTDVESIARSNEFATFWIGHASLFIAQTQFTVPPSHSLVVSEQAQLEQPQPQLWGHNEDVFLAALSVPLKTTLVIPQQESGEQTQPVFVGQQPLPSPAVGLSKVAAPSDVEAVARASELAAFWDGKATLQIAAVQFDLPPSKRITGVPQESGEQYQPVLFGQQPLPSHAVGLSKTAAPSDVESIARASEYATFWIGHASLFIAQSQFTVPPSHALVVSEQPQLDQSQPQFWGHNEDAFLAAFSVPLGNTRIVPQQESGEQVQPTFAGQTPLPSPAVGLTKVTAPSDVEAVARNSEFAAFWDGKATLQIASVQFDVPPSKRISAAPQESGEQYQPIVQGQQPLPSPAVGLSKIAAPSDVESVARSNEFATFWIGHASLFIALSQFDVPPRDSVIVDEQPNPDQPQPQIWGRNEDAFLDATSIALRRALVVGEQQSGEQQQPIFSGQQPLPTPPVGLTKFAAPSDAQAIAEASQYATVWVGDASLYVAVTQDVPARHALIVAEQDRPEQIQPQFSRGQIPVESVPSKYVWQSGDVEGSQSAAFWGASFIESLTPDAFTNRPLLIVSEQPYTFQPQPQFNLYYFLDSVVVVVPPVTTGGGDRGVNLFRAEPEKAKQKSRQADFRVRFVQEKYSFSARFGAESELKVLWLAEKSLDLDAEFEAASELRVRLEQQNAMAASFEARGSQQRQVPVKALHQTIRLGVQFVAPETELTIKFEVES